MTLLVALKGSDGLALAADSRGTFGDPRAITAQNDSQQKAHILTRHAAALQAGSGEVGAMILRDVASELSHVQIDGASQVMEHLRQAARVRYSDWFPSVPPIQAPALAMSGNAPVRPDLVYIVGGYEMDSDGRAMDARLYQLGSANDFSPMLHDYGFAVAGVAQYALYLLNRLYQPDRSVEELTALAVYVITETASQDGKVGGTPSVITIRPGAGCDALASGEVAEIVSQNERRSTALRDSFYRGTNRNGT